MNDLTVSDNRFSYSLNTLEQIARDILTEAKQGGATACETNVTDGFGQTVTIRQNAVETIEYNRDKGLSVTVYIGQKRGNASTSDFSPKAIRDTVAAALSIARYTAEDDCAGLAEKAQLGFAADARITNSEGATVSTSQSQFIYANSLGFMGGYPVSQHSVSCALIAEQNDSKQRDYWYSVARDAADLESAKEIGRKTGMRSAARLGARKIATCEVPVLFEAPIASSLIGHFAAAISGGSLYRKSSFLLNSIGQQVFAPHVQILESPHLHKGLGSSAFDEDGVATVERKIVENGIVQGYFLSSYSARKLKMTTTGNAGGTHNLMIQSTNTLDIAGLLEKMQTGLLVTELLGHGVNGVTGDYSRGASGFWVEKGRIAYPVEEITIAGNLKDIYRGIVAIGNDVVVRGSKQSGSILIDRMTIAGN